MTYLKDPGDTLQYGFDWTDWLDGDTISASEWDLPATLGDDAGDHDDTGTTVLVSGGTAGRTYTITNRITTAAGQTAELSMRIRISQR